MTSTVYLGHKAFNQRNKSGLRKIIVQSITLLLGHLIILKGAIAIKLYLEQLELDCTAQNGCEQGHITVNDIN